MKGFLKKRWVYHTIIWVVGYLFFCFIDAEDNEDIVERYTRPFLLYFPVIVITYSGFFAKNKLFDQRKYVSYAISFVFIIILGLLLFEAMKLIDVFVNNSINQNITNIIFVMLLSIGLQYFKRGIINQAQLQELRAKTAETELNALKAQINPHFLFNTLNNIYGMNQIDSEKGSEMILELSDVMRYHLEFSKIDHVRLEDEIQLIDSYIKLERLRLNDNCDIQIDLSSVDETLHISPLLFLSYVENAFKHGTHPIHPCFIHILMKTEGRKIFFEITNSIIKDRKVVKTNIGMENTKRRLELIYPGTHNLTITQVENKFKVKLTIEL